VLPSFGCIRALFFTHNTPFSYSPHVFSVLHAVSTMSDYEDFEDDFDRVSIGPPPSDVYSSRGAHEKDFVDIGSQRMPRPPLRSRPQMDFSGQQIPAETDHGFTIPPVPRRPPSHLSGSTLRTNLNHPAAAFYSHKQYSSYELPPDLPSEVLASLMVAQLYQNPN
jgi:hypothetical protein